MATRSNYERAILQELKEIPAEKLPKLLQLIRLLKEEISSTQKMTANALQDIDDLAVSTGIPDLAVNHDHYLYHIDRNG